MPRKKVIAIPSTSAATGVKELVELYKLRNFLTLEFMNLNNDIRRSNNDIGQVPKDYHDRVENLIRKHSVIKEVSLKVKTLEKDLAVLGVNIKSIRENPDQANIQATQVLRGAPIHGKTLKEPETKPPEKSVRNRRRT